MPRLLSWVVALVLGCGLGAGYGRAAELGAWGVLGRHRQSPLVQPANLQVVGYFRLPGGVHGISTFSFGGRAMSYNPTHGTLVLACGNTTDYPVWALAEVSIPAPVDGATLGDLNTATMTQDCTDVGGGHYLDGVFGATIFRAGRLFGDMYLYYDGAGNQRTSHYEFSPDFSIGWLVGPWQIGPNSLIDNGNYANAGYVAGYMAEIPEAWRGLLGGPVITGQNDIPIKARTSYAPAAIVFDPETIGGLVNPPPATALMYQNGAVGHHRLEDLGLVADYSETFGLVFPVGTDSVLYFGRHGTTASCYGFGVYVETSGGHTNGDLVTQADHRLPVPDGSGDLYCYDHVITSKGPHGYPYAFNVWAYDAKDLAAVKAAAVNPATASVWQPWEVMPYATWHLDFSRWVADPQSLLGAAYDPESGRIYLTVDKGDGSLPVVAVLKVVL